MKMAENGNARVTKILEQLPGIPERFKTSQISLFISELLKWNQRLGLVSKRNTGQVVVDLIRRSMALWDFVEERAPLVALREGARVVDIGSGGGFPGVIWQLMQPEISVTVVERKTKKALFLQRLAVILNVAGFAVEEKDVELLAAEAASKETFDIAVMMAVAPPGDLATAVEALLKPGGVFATLRGRNDAVFPGTIGSTMVIHSAVAGPEGPMLLYEKPRYSSPK